MDDANTDQLIKLLEELYSGWSETTDRVRQRNGHPPKEHTEIMISYLINDLRSGAIKLQVGEKAFFVNGPRPFR